MSDVAIIMGSDSDWPVMEEAAKVLDQLGISYEADVVSAHRMPLEMVEFAQNAAGKGFKVIITHQKPPASSEAKIKKQLQEQNNLGLELIFPEQGKRFEL